MTRFKFHLIYQYKWNRDEHIMLRGEIRDETQLDREHVASDGRRERLAKIERAVANGTYAIPAEEVADSLLLHMMRRATPPRSSQKLADSKDAGPDA